MEGTLESIRRLVGLDAGLAVAITLRPVGTPHASVVNAGVLPHPVGGDPVVGFISAGGAMKLRNLRRRPYASVLFRAGWEWASAEGPVELVGPQDPLDGLDREDIRLLLRAVFTAGGGTHDDFDEYDRVMAAESRTAVLIHPDRLMGNASH